MEDIVREAIEFYNAVRRENEIDLTGPPLWNYVLTPLEQTHVEEAIELLRKQGFTPVTGTYDQQSGTLTGIRASEAVVHNLDSFARRIQGLVDFAREHKFQLVDWNVEDQQPGGEEPSGADQRRIAAAPSGRITRQEIGAFACKVMALWMLVAAALGAGQAAWGIRTLMIERPLTGVSSSMAGYMIVAPVQALLAGIVLWCLAGALGRLMVRGDPSPIMGIELDAGQLLGVALAVFGVYLLVAGVRSLAYLVWDNWDCLGSLPVLLGRRSFHSYFWSMLIDLAAGLWLMLGSHGLVELRRRLGSDRLSSGAEGGLQ